jgi:hypothetical protein
LLHPFFRPSRLGMGAAARRTASGTQCRAAYLDGAGLRDDPKGPLSICGGRSFQRARAAPLRGEFRSYLTGTCNPLIELRQRIFPKILSSNYPYGEPDHREAGKRYPTRVMPISTWIPWEKIGDEQGGIIEPLRTKLLDEGPRSRGGFRLPSRSSGSAADADIPPARHIETTEWPRSGAKREACPSALAA